MKTGDRRKEAGSGLSGRQGRTIPVAMLLILVVLISASSGIYAGASFFAQQAPGVTVTTTIYTTTTSWTTSTIWSIVTQTVQGVLTTVQYTTSTSTITVTGPLPTIKTLTARGIARISTAQSEFGGASGLFNGNGAYLSTQDSPDWASGTGDFTIDFWVRFVALPAASGVQYILSQYVDGSNVWAVDLYNSAGTYKWEIFAATSAGGSFLTVSKSSAGLSINTWYHLAFVRSGNSWYVFQDGTQCGTTDSDADGMPDLAGSLYIAARGAGANLFNGWLDEFRISKGVARWTSNFTPPTAPYLRDSSTVLLLHMDGADATTTFIDSY